MIENLTLIVLSRFGFRLNENFKSDINSTLHLSLYLSVIISKLIHIVLSTKVLWIKKWSPQNIKKAFYTLYYDRLVVSENMVEDII